MGAVDLLVQHGVGVQFQGKETFRYCPIQIAAGVAAPSEVIARLLELRASLSGRGGLAMSSPLHQLVYRGDSPGHNDSERRRC